MYVPKWTCADLALTPLERCSILIEGQREQSTGAVSELISEDDKQNGCRSLPPNIEENHELGKPHQRP